MALTLNTNSYVDVTYANNYFSERLYTSEWDMSDTTTKEKALIQATRWLDTQRLAGTPTTTSQALHFPTDGATDVPNDIKIATCEKALNLLKSGGGTSSTTIVTGQLKSRKIGDIEESYTTSADTKTSVTSATEDDIITGLLKPYLYSTVVSIVR